VIRAVPDVNVFVSLAIKKDGHSAQIFKRSGEFISFTSEKILADVLRVMHYERVLKIHKMSEGEISEFVQRLRERNAVSPGNWEGKIVHEDPDDDIIVACAIEVGADYIISGDHHLLDLKHYREIQIVSPRAFLDILDRQKALQSS
jgi:hypothetical protein